MCSRRAGRLSYLETGRLSDDGARVLFHGRGRDSDAPAVLDLASMRFLAMPAETTASTTRGTTFAFLDDDRRLAAFDKSIRTLRCYDTAL